MLLEVISSNGLFFFNYAIATYKKKDKRRSFYKNITFLSVQPVPRRRGEQIKSDLAALSSLLKREREKNPAKCTQTVEIEWFSRSDKNDGRWWVLG